MPDPETDPDVDVDDVDDLDSAAIAAAMGFSSFGSQAHPNKKRRFNPLADAVIDSPWDNRPPAARPGPPRPPTTSANAVPVRNTRAPMSLPPPATLPATLPPRPVVDGAAPFPPPAPPQANTDEIDVDLDDDQDEAGPQYMDTSRPIGEVRDHGLGPEEQVGVPRQGEDAAAFHARMQAVVAAGNAKYAVTQTASGPASEQLDGSVLSTGHGGRLKDRHGFRADLAPGGAGIGGGLGGGDALDEGASAGVLGETVAEPQLPGGKGQGQQDWWTGGYYDPQSNENPWLGLETRLQLPPRDGCWLETGHYKGQLGPGGGGHRGGGGGGRGRGNSQNRGRGPRRF